MVCDKETYKKIMDPESDDNHSKEKNQKKNSKLANSQSENNLEELEKAPSPVNKPAVRPGQITVVDKFGNFRLISSAGTNNRSKVSRSPSRERSVRSCSRSHDSGYRNDRERYQRPRGGWHTKRRNFGTNSRNNHFNRSRLNRSRSRSRNRHEKTVRSERRRSEEKNTPDCHNEKFDENKDMEIPDERNLKQMEDFLARVREVKRKKMMEENKDFLRQKS